MEPNDTEPSSCSGSLPVANAPPPRTAARPRATARMHRLGRADGAVSEGCPLDSPRPGKILTQLEEESNNLGRECMPVPRLRGPCAAATIQTTKRSGYSPPCSMRKAMGDSSQVAVAVNATGCKLPAEPPTPRASPRSKAASKKEVDVVIEIPVEVGKAIRSRNVANGTIKGKSLPALPPAPPAQEPSATETFVNIGEQSATTAVQHRRNLFLLKSISTTIGTTLSRLFGRGHSHEEPPPGIVQTDAARQSRSPLEVSVEIQVCPEEWPARSAASAQSAASSAAFQDDGAYQSRTGDTEVRAPQALSLTQVVTVKASGKVSKSQGRDEIIPGKESRSRGREQKVLSKRRTEASPMGNTLKEISSESTRLSGESREAVAAAKSDMEATKAASKKTEESVERAVSSFEGREVSSTLREKKARKGKSESPAKTASRKVKSETVRRAPSHDGIESPQEEVPAEAKLNAERNAVPSVAETMKSAEMQEDLHFEEASLEGTHSPVQKPLKSSMKKASSSEHLAEMLDVYTKRTEMLKSEIKKKGGRDKKKSAEAEAASRGPPEAMDEGHAGATAAESPKAGVKKSSKDKRKPSAIEVAPPKSPEAMDDGFTRAITSAKAESLKAGTKKSARDKRKASKYGVTSPGSAEALEEGFIVATTTAKAESPKARKKKPAKDKGKGPETGVTSPGSAEAMDEGFTGPATAVEAESPKTKKKKPAKDKRKASKTGVKSPGSAEAIDEGFTGATTGAEAESPKARKKKPAKDKGKGSKTGVTPPGSAEAIDEGFAGATTGAQAESPKARKKKPAKDKGKASKTGVTLTRSAVAMDKWPTGATTAVEAESPKAFKKPSKDKRKFSRTEVVSRESPEAKHEVYAGTIEVKAGTEVEAIKKSVAKLIEAESCSPDEKAEVITSAELSTKGVGGMKRKARALKEPAASHPKEKLDAITDGTVKQVATGGDKTRTKTSEKDSRKKKRSPGIDNTREAQSPMELEENSAAKKAAKMTPSPRKTSQQKTEPGKREVKTKASDASKKRVRKLAEDEDELGGDRQARAKLSDEDRLRLAALLGQVDTEAATGTGNVDIPQEAEQKDTPVEGLKDEEKITESVLQKSLAKAEKAAEVLVKGAEGASSGEDDEVVRVFRRRRDSIAVHRMAGMKKEKRPVTESEPELGGLFSIVLGRKEGAGEGAKEGKSGEEPELPKPAVKKGGKRVAAMAAREELTTAKTDNATKGSGAHQLVKRGALKTKHGEGKSQKAENRRSGDGHARTPPSDEKLRDEDLLQPAAAQGDKPTEETIGFRKMEGPEGEAEVKEAPAEGPKEEGSADSVLRKSLAKAEKAAGILEGGEDAGGGEDDEVVRVVRRRRDSLAVHRMIGMKKQKQPVSENEPEFGGLFASALGRKLRDGKDSVKEGNNEKEPNARKSSAKEGGKPAAPLELIPEKAENGTKPADTMKTSTMGAASPSVEGGPTTTADFRRPSKPVGERQGRHGPHKTSGADSLSPASPVAKTGLGSLPQSPQAVSAYGTASPDAGLGSLRQFTEIQGSPSPVAEDRRRALPPPFHPEGGPWSPVPQLPGAVPMGPQPPLDVDSRMNLMSMRGRMPPRHGRRKHGKSRGRKGPYAVGDSASKDLPPGKMKFSRIKLSAKQPRGEEGSPPVLHSPILDIGSPSTSPKGGSPVASPMASVVTSGIPERDKGAERDVSSVAGEGAAAEGHIAESKMAALMAESEKSPNKGDAAKPAKRKKKKRVRKSTRSNLKPQSEALSMRELLLQIRQRKLGNEAATTERRKTAEEEEHVPAKVKKSKKKVEKRTADTQTSLPFAEPETPAVMLQSGEKHLCDFRFAVGVGRVVRGAVSHLQSLGLPTSAGATKGETSSRPVLPSEASGLTPLPSRGLEIDAPVDSSAALGERTVASSLAGVASDTSGARGKPTAQPPTERYKQPQPRKRKKPKQESRSRKERDRKQRKKKRAPKHASSVAFLFRWRAPTAQRAGNDPGSVAYPMSVAGMASKMPGSQSKQLPRLFSWTTKATVSTTAEEELKLPKSVSDAQLTAPVSESAAGTVRMPPLRWRHAGSNPPESGGAFAQDESGGDVGEGKKVTPSTDRGMQEVVPAFQSKDAPLHIPPFEIDSAGFDKEKPSLPAQDEVSGDALPRYRGKGETVADMQGTATGLECELGVPRTPLLSADRAGCKNTNPCVLTYDEKYGDASLQCRKVKGSTSDVQQTVAVSESAEEPMHMPPVPADRAARDENYDVFGGRNENDAIADVQRTVPFSEYAKETMHVSPLPTSRSCFGITEPLMDAMGERNADALLAKRRKEKTVPDFEYVERALDIPSLTVHGGGVRVVGVTAQDKRGGGAPRDNRGKVETDVIKTTPNFALPSSATVTVSSSAHQSIAEGTGTIPEATVVPQDSTQSEKSGAIVVPGTRHSAEPLQLCSKEETSDTVVKREHTRKRNGEMDKWREMEIEREITREGEMRAERSPKAMDVEGEIDRSGLLEVTHAKSLSPDAKVHVRRRLENNGPEISSAITGQRRKKHASSSPEGRPPSISRRNTSMSPTDGSPQDGSRGPSWWTRSGKGNAHRTSSRRKRSCEGSPGRISPEKRICTARAHMRRKNRNDGCRSKKSGRPYYRSFEDQSVERKTAESNEHKTRKPGSSGSRSTPRIRGPKGEESGSAHSKTGRSDRTSSWGIRPGISSTSKVGEGSSPERRCGASASSSTSSSSPSSYSTSESPLRERTSPRDKHKRKRKRSGRGSRERKRKRRQTPGKSPSSHGSRHLDRVVRIRSIDRVAENYNRSQTLACCCLLLLSASVALLLILSTSVLYYALKTSPAALVSYSKAETKTYTISTRQTRETFIPVTDIIHYCDTAFCSQEAQYVASVVGPERRPCVNFYEHVCDKWLGQQATHSAGIQALLSRDTILQDSLAQQLLRLIRNSPERDVKTAAKLYYSCAVNRNASEDTAALKTLFDRWEIRLWPRTDHENLTSLSVWRFSAELARDLDIATLFIVSVGVDPGYAGATILELDSLRSQFSDTDTEYEQVYKGAIREAVAEISTTLASPLDDFADRLINVSGVLRSASLQATSDETLTVLRVDELGDGVREFVETLLSNIHGRISEKSMKVAAKSPSYVRANLQTALVSVPPLDALNFIGFQVLVRLAPFLPERLHSLRTLYGKSIIGRTLADVTDTPQLCLWLVEHSLPGCFTKASHQLLRQRGQQEALRGWLDLLESLFLKHVVDFTWVSNLASLLVRYRFKRRQVTQFGRSKDEHSCAPVFPSGVTTNPLLYFLNLSTYRSHWRLRGLEANSSVLRQRGNSGSELRTVATFDQSLHRVHVPAALFNLSVPSNSSFSVFQLARVAVRFYRGLVQALYENPYERDVPLSFTDESRRRLADLTTCFLTDAQRSSHIVWGARSPPEQTLVGKLLLDQTSALLLALRAFDELLHVHRNWEADHRLLRDLPLQSARQLFFVYFALDNCESTQAASHRDHGMAAKLRVNLPLRHVRLFAEAFNCTFADHMATAPGESCDVLRSLRAGQRRHRGTLPMELTER